MTSDFRQRIVIQARTWIGTKFHHQGRVKKTFTHSGGCDCLGLIVGVAQEVGLTYEGRPITDFDETDYGHLPDGNRLIAALERYCVAVPVADIQPGDILLFRFDGNPQHVGLVSEYPLSIDGGETIAPEPPLKVALLQGNRLGLIHCYADVRQVVEHRLDEGWRERIVGVYMFPGLG